ncbi:MAG: YdcF family protein, partial [Rhodothermales bacterium]
MSTHRQRTNERLLVKDARDLNTIASFLCRRDISAPTPAQLEAAFGIKHADVMILAGNSLLQSARAVADGWHAGAAKSLLVAGGIGHSTADLRSSVRSEERFGDIDVDDRSEAEILKGVLATWMDVDPAAIMVETRSTNCGANAEASRRVLDHRGIHPRSIVIVQDPLLQRRTHAAFVRVWADRPSVHLISCPPFVPVVDVRDGRLAYSEPAGPPPWEIPRFLS